MKKNIVIVNNHMRAGGVEKSLIALLNEIDYNRYNVELALFNHDGILLEDIPNEVKIIEKRIPIGFEGSIYTCLKQLLKNKKIYHIFLRILQAIVSKIFTGEKKSQYIALIASYAMPKLDKEYDIAIAYKESAVTYYTMNRVNAKKKICYYHNDYSKQRVSTARFDFKYFNRFDKIITVSKDASKILKETFPSISEKIEIIYNMIPYNLILKQSKYGETFKDSFKGVRIYTICRLNHQKGVDIAINVLKKLRDNGYNVRWYISGGGNQDELKCICKTYGIENEFIFLGETKNPYKYLKECDIYVQPSRWEGYCISLAEARVMCKPIVTTNFSGAMEQVVNNKTAIITNVNIDEIYDSIKKLLDDKNLMKNLSINLEKQLNNEYGNDNLYRFYNLLDS